jgi:hypothetical protein
MRLLEIDINPSGRFSLTFVISDGIGERGAKLRVLNYAEYKKQEVKCNMKMSPNSVQEDQ